MAIPRFLWCILLSAVLLALSWGGRDKLYSILENFLPLIGYWTICFGSILFIEHFWFRPRLPGGYDLGAWQDQKRMPWGLGGIGSLLIGIGFSFLGMAQTWVSGISYAFCQRTPSVILLYSTVDLPCYISTLTLLPSLSTYSLL